MSRWDTVVFDDVLKIINGRNQRNVENPNGRYPIYGSGGVMSYADDYLCEKDTVIIGRKGTINSPIYVDKPFWNVDTAFGLRPDERMLFPKYLYYFCERFDFEALNTTVTIPSLTKANLLKIEMPLPPLSVQQKIADILDRTVALIKKRKAQVAKLDLLVKSQFIEMFGDPATNPMGWEQTTVQDLVNRGILEKPLDGNHGEKHPKSSDYVEEGVPFVMANNLIDGVVDFSSCYYIPRSQAEKLDKGFAKCGDVLITHKGTIGRTAILENCFDYIMLTPQVTYYRIKNNLNNRFLKSYFDSGYFQDMMAHLASAGSTRAYIGITAQRELPILLPPIDLQNQFATFIHAVEKSKSEMRQGLDKLELLYKSLIQKCFPNNYR